MCRSLVPLYNRTFRALGICWVVTGRAPCSNLLLGSWGKILPILVVFGRVRFARVSCPRLSFVKILPLRLLIWGPPPSSTLTFRALQSTPAHFSSTSPGKEASEIVSAPDPLGSGVFHLTFLSTWVRRRAPQQDPRTSLQLRLLRRLRNNRLASSSRLAPAKTATSASLSTAWLRS